MKPAANRIKARFAALKKAGKKAFVAYISAGDPHLDATVEIAVALDGAGVDVLELGVPFSDPMADGVAIQASYERALKAGATPGGVIEAVRRIRLRSQMPILLFTYLNPVLAYGAEAFARDAAAAGVDGVLLLDLPPEQDPAMLKTFQDAGLATICLSAPTTLPARRRFLMKRSRGFLYYICRLGVTGERVDLPADLAERVAELKAVADLPVCIGFGISTPEQAAAAARCGDGAIVGSHFVRLIEANATDPELAAIVARRAGELAAAVHAV